MRRVDSINLRGTWRSQKIKLSMKVWQETGCRAVVESLAGSRQRFSAGARGFPHRFAPLFSGGSDRAADRWRQD
jgi:hypothetical protein